MLQQKNNVIAKNAACFLTARIGIVPEAVIEKGRFNILCWWQFFKTHPRHKCFLFKCSFLSKCYHLQVHFLYFGYLSFTLSWTICLCGVKMDRVCCSKDISIVFSSYARDSIFNYFRKFVTFPSLYCILSIGDWDCDLHYVDKLAELMEAWVWNSTIVENNFKKWFKDSTHFRPIWGRV